MPRANSIPDRPRGYILGVTSETVAAAELSPTRAWWLRVPAVLLSPRSVFFALREDDEDDVAARSEPLLLIILLAGIAAVLATPTAADLLDNPEYDALLLAVWAFIAGALYGAVGYFVFGFAVYFGVRLLDSAGNFRRARQTVGFALVPLAASLFVTLPLRLALYGGDTFRGDWADDGLGGDLLLGLQLGAAVWSLALLAVGVRVTHGWDWLRTLASLVATAALLAAIYGVFRMI
jgi:Yip1 domain